MDGMILFCIGGYFLSMLPVVMLIWAALVLAKQDDTVRGYDLLEGQ